jgi:hypothetical protein
LTTRQGESRRLLVVNDAAIMLALAISQRCQRINAAEKWEKSPKNGFDQIRESSYKRVLSGSENSF